MAYGQNAPSFISQEIGVSEIQLTYQLVHTLYIHNFFSHIPTFLSGL